MCAQMYYKGTGKELKVPTVEFWLNISEPLKVIGQVPVMVNVLVKLVKK